MVYYFKKLISLPLFRHKSGAGFTLIELMVSLAIFAAIIGIGVGVFLSSFRVQSQAQEVSQILDNARFALERIAKSIRVSRVETANTPLDSPTSSLDIYHFRRAKDLKYKLENEKVKEVEDPTGSSLESELTGERVEVKNLSFFIQGVGAGDNRQPQVTIVLKVRPRIERWQGEDISLQTTVSQRCLEKVPSCVYP